MFPKYRRTKVPYSRFLQYTTIWNCVAWYLNFLRELLLLIWNSSWWTIVSIIFSSLHNKQYFFFSWFYLYNLLRTWIYTKTRLKLLQLNIFVAGSDNLSIIKWVWSTKMSNLFSVSSETVIVFVASILLWKQNAIL